MTVKKRITLLVAWTGFITTLLFSVVLFYELIEQPFDILDRELKEEAYRAIKMRVTGQSKSEFPPADPDDAEFYPYWLRIYEQDSNRMLYQSQLAKRVNLPSVEPDASAIVSAIVPPERIEPGQDSGREVTFRIRTFLLSLEGGTFAVQIARPMEKLAEEIWELVFSIGAGLIFCWMALAAISQFVAGKILEPIGKMKDLTREISEKNLDQRIPTGPGRDEFSELARTINWMLDRLQNSFMKQRDFLFDTSHELKTPLTTMRLAIEEIFTSDMGSLPASVKENLFQLNDQVLRMERLVKDLLNLSSLESLAGIDPKPVDISGLLSSLSEDYRLLATAQNVQMDIRLPRRLIIQGDAGKLNRAFSNILDNAIKYNVAGGRVEVDSDESDADPADSDLTITVTNTGPGVSEAQIDKVFDQFYRVEQSRSLQHGGSGLGLAIVKRIVELHHGKITFESKPEVWTRVTVSLPRSQEMTSQ